MNKLILIPAQPSSGTSALAGVLTTLGVDMGATRTSKQKKRRGYKMYEDDDMGQFQEFHELPINRVGKILNYGFYIRRYINYRLSKPGAFRGAKLPAVWCIGDSDIGSLPIVTLDVTRPLEVSLDADMATWHKANPGMYDSRPDLLITHEILRSTDLAACNRAKKIIFKYHEPVFRTSFDELIAQREEKVQEIVDVLGLQCSEQQMRNAVNFLDKDKKHY